MTHASVSYLYCVVDAARRPSVANVPGGLPGGTTPEVVGVTPRLWVAVSEVPASEYRAARLDARLRDLDWVSSIALAHEAVVEHFARRRGATVIPMKLFTMFSSVARTVAEIAARRAALERAIRRVTGCEEWGLRVTRSTAPPARTRASSPSISAAGGPVSGTAFLAQRKQARDRTRLERQHAMACAEDVFEHLAGLARDVTRRERGAEPGSNPPLLEAAFLVPRGSRGRLEREARRLARRGAAAAVDVTLSGPWPPYNFVSAAEDR